MDEPSRSASSSYERLFFALWPGGEERQEIVRATRSLVKASGGKPVPAENLHITLVFLGSLETSRVEAIREAAARANGGAFDLELDRVGHWPRPRILWLAPTIFPVALTQLVDSLWLALEACDIGREQRPFKPHMTLARKVGSPRRLDNTRAVPWQVRDFMLVKSVTTPRNATYSVIDSWRLGQATMTTAS